MKIAINTCWGRFSLSKEAYEHMGLEWDGYGYAFSIDGNRADPKLIECIEALGEKANGDCSKITIVDIPDDVKWYIYNYEGQESVEEHHRSWR